MLRRTFFLAALGTALAGLLGSSASAQSFTPGDPRESGRAADIVPLREVFSRLKDRYGGYQLDAELFSTSGGGVEYRIEWMTGEGRRMRISVDARTGRITRSSGG
ncbi:MAG: hypothetical protein AAFX86_06490 [Pseudomonadota bacterium]